MTATRILQALDVLVNGPAPPPPSLIPIERARICAERECSLVFSSDDARACPACGSDSVSMDTLAKVTSARVLEFRERLAASGRAQLQRDIERRAARAR